MCIYIYIHINLYIYIYQEHSNSQRKICSLWAPNFAESTQAKTNSAVIGLKHKQNWRCHAYVSTFSRVAILGATCWNKTWQIELLTSHERPPCTMILECFVTLYLFQIFFESIWIVDFWAANWAEKKNDETTNITKRFYWMYIHYYINDIPFCWLQGLKLIESQTTVSWIPHLEHMIW